MNESSHLLLILCLLSTIFTSLVSPAQSNYASPLPYPLYVHYMAPFLSGGGFSSESVTIALSLISFWKSATTHLGQAALPNTHPTAFPNAFNVTLHLQHHGDAFNKNYLRFVSKDTFSTLLPHFHVNDAPFYQLAPTEFEKKQNLVVICHSEPGAWNPPLFDTLECPLDTKSRLGRSYDMVRIGRSMFETDRIPEGWRDRLNAMDEVWVPTDWQRDIYLRNGVKENKLRIVAEPVDTGFFNPQKYQNVKSPFDPRMKTFLSIFKWEKRKGWDVLIKAFLEEFKLEDNVQLVLIISKYHDDENKSFEEKIDAFIKTYLPEEKWNHAPRILVRQNVPLDMMPLMYMHAQAFVLPSRGEGFGRPHMEAMCMETPVIATNWSGPVSYLNETNGFPLRVRELVEIDEGAFMGHKWAEPDEAHLRELLRFVFANPSESQKRGEVARRHMMEKYSLDVFGRELFNILGEIQDRFWGGAKLGERKSREQSSHEEL